MVTTPRILLVTFYYQPDLSAGSFRTAAMVEALLQQRPNLAIDVMTTAPHRYHGLTSSPMLAEDPGGRLSVRRIKLPAHQSGMVDQAKAFAHYAREASKAVRGETYDLVVATSARLMTAALGAWIARRVRAPLYLDIRDIFTENLRTILPRSIAMPLQPAFGVLERWTINRAVHVNLVSRGFTPYFQAHYPRQSFTYFTNGVDDEFLPGNLPAAPAKRPAGSALQIVYAGNLGEAQGLHLIVPLLAQRLGARVNFKLIGDGGRRRQLEQVLSDAGIGNVEIARPMSREALIKEYVAADALFLHLNDFESFETVLPSKIFEYAALGKPIWAGVAGYPAEFLRQEVSNVAVFAPCDVEAALQSFDQLKMCDAPRTSFVEKYSRPTIMRAMAADILAHIREP